MSPALARSLCEAFHGLRLVPCTAQPIVRIQPFSSTTIALARKVKKKNRNPYAVARAKEVKAKNIARHEELEAQRAASRVDPIKGADTPFNLRVETPPPPPPSVDRARALAAAGQMPEDVKLAFEGERRNFFLKTDKLEKFMKSSKILSAPRYDDMTDKSVYREAEALHQNAMEAITRIAALGNASSKDLTRLNKQVAIDMFGRHVTDKSLPSDPQHEARFQQMKLNKTPRAGPDTGSSEVQAAILTIKIRKLAKHVEENKKDKHNKRNLRLLSHKRQKLLRYLQRSDKGGARYRNVMEAIGLDDAAIERQIVL